MNSVFLVVIAAMILIVVLLRFKVLIGPAILSGGLLIGSLSRDPLKSFGLRSLKR